VLKQKNVIQRRMLREWLAESIATDPAVKARFDPFVLCEPPETVSVYHL
jgi:hypothetical protein